MQNTVWVCTLASILPIIQMLILYKGGHKKQISVSKVLYSSVAQVSNWVAMLKFTSSVRYFVFINQDVRGDLLLHLQH